MRDQRYIGIALLGGLIAFAIFNPISHIPSGVLIALDAAGLSLFGVSGAAKSLVFDATAVTAVILGGVTATGGGVMRDLLLGKTPAVLRIDIYATAALLGAAVTTIGIRQGRPRGATMILGGSVCFILRIIAAWQHGGLPHAGAL